MKRGIGLLELTCVTSHRPAPISPTDKRAFHLYIVTVQPIGIAHHMVMKGHEVVRLSIALQCQQGWVSRLSANRHTA